MEKVCKAAIPEVFEAHSHLTKMDWAIELQAYLSQSKPSC